MSGRLAGKTALITGGTRGIGEAIATAFAREGARTIVASRRPEGVEAAVARLRDATGAEVHGIPLHVGQPDAVAQAAASLLERFGPIDVLVNNAATSPHFGPMMEIDVPAWEKTFEVNLLGPFLLSRALARALIDAGKPGSIVNVASILGQMAAPLQGAYGMTKAAIISMTRTMAVELGPAGIRVNAIAPGIVETKLASVLTSTPEFRKMFEDRTAFGRIAQPADIAGAAVFLASDESSYVTGHTLNVDGGYAIR